MSRQTIDLVTLISCICDQRNIVDRNTTFKAVSHFIRLNVLNHAKTPRSTIGCSDKMMVFILLKMILLQIENPYRAEVGPIEHE